MKLGIRLQNAAGRNLFTGVATFLLFSGLALSLAAEDTPAKAADTTPVRYIDEDSADWNCLTMGNQICGTGWTMVDQQLGDALAEGVGDGDDTRDWELCMVNEGDTTYIACPDGYTTSS